MAASSLLKTIYRNEDNLYQQVVRYIAAGADLNEVTRHSESALRVASNNGRFDVVKLLLDSGADSSQLVWSAIHFAVVFRSVSEVRAAVSSHKDKLETRDFWSRTPYLLSILTGDIDKASTLVELGADSNCVGRRGKTVFQYAIQHDDVAMVDWLVQNGHDPNAVDEFNTTPLIAASELGKIRSAQYLIENGVDIYQSDDIPNRAIEVASCLEIVDLLLAKGEDINDVSDRIHREIIGTGNLDCPGVPHEVYEAEKHCRFGQGNPEEVHHSFWNDMIQSGVSAWQARDKYGDTADSKGAPVWCFERFGRTTNILADGRVVVIAGEHEDSYDPDFYIYNDIVIFEADQTPRVFCYPEAEFPPTDFHTATLVGDKIIIIGCLGYPQSRRVGQTPVYSLEIDTLQMTKLSTSGENPGWISQHKTSLSAGELIVSGGEVWVEVDGSHDMIPNTGQFVLCLETLCWSLRKEQ